MVKIEFEIESDHGTFRDSILLPENHNLTDFEIEDIKQQRFNDWIASIQSAFQANPDVLTESQE